MELTCKEGIGRNIIVSKKEHMIQTLLRLKRGLSCFKTWRESKRKAKSMIFALNLQLSKIELV